MANAVLTLKCWTRGDNGEPGSRIWIWVPGDPTPKENGQSLKGYHVIEAIERMEVLADNVPQLVLWASPFNRTSTESKLEWGNQDNPTPNGAANPLRGRTTSTSDPYLSFVLPVRCLLIPSIANDAGRDVPTYRYLKGDFFHDSSSPDRIMLRLLQLTGYELTVASPTFIDLNGVEVSTIQQTLRALPTRVLPKIVASWQDCPSAEILRLFSETSQLQFVPTNAKAGAPVYIKFSQTDLAPVDDPDITNLESELVDMPFGLSHTESHQSLAWWENVSLEQRPSQAWLDLDFDKQPIRPDFDWRLEISGISATSVGQAWGRTVIQPLLSSLRTVRDALRITSLPDWSATTTGTWSLRAMVTERWSARRQLSLNLDSVDPRTGQPRLPDLIWSPETYRLFPTAWFKAKFYFSGMPNVVGSYLSCTGWIDVLAGDIDSDIAANDITTGTTSSGPGIRFKFGFDPINNATDDDKLRFRVGALELALGSSGGAISDSQCKIRLREIADDSGMPRRLEDGRLCPGFIPRIEILDLSLPVAKVAPGTQDRMPLAPFDPANPTDGLESPIIIELFSGTQPTGASYIFHTSEQTTDAYNSDFQSQSLIMDLTLESNGGASGSNDYLLVLDPQPFSVFLVSVPPPQSGSGENVPFAKWELSAANPIPSWQYRLPTSEFDLLMPPQTVGEAMEKGVSADGYNDIKPGAGADFRFAPPALFQLDPSYYDQAFSEMPWNLRRLLGYPGQRAAGPWLKQAQFEFLYGLTTTLAPASNTTHFSEIFARLGMPVQQIPSFDNLDSDTQRELAVAGPQTAPSGKISYWETIRRDRRAAWLEWLSRLGVYELWRESSPNNTVFDGAEISGNLRPQADLRYPIPGASPRSANIPHAATGLAGSYAWAFESQNIYEQLWRSPSSSSAELSNPLFSALGGYGEQTMRFCNDLTAIISKVSMGRVSTLRLERLGRIGIFWNRAKHVIVYERTVVPTDQFRGEQDPLLGRMVLRKTQEYVELLEPDRAYPEFSQDQSLSGFVCGLTFVSKRINVDSRWGADVADRANKPVGWKVPLWSYLANQDLPQVYTKPQVSKLVATGTATDPQNLYAPILNPENLCFYTSTLDSDGKDTDAWSPVWSIDFGDCPRLSAPSDTHNFSSDLDGTLNNDPALGLDALPASYNAFTFRLGPTANGSNLTFARSDKIIGAQIRNVSLMRGTPTGPGAGGNSGLGQNLHALLQNIEDAADAGAAGLADYHAKVGGFLPTLTAKATADAAGLIDKCVAQADLQVQGTVGRAVDTAQSFLQQQVNSAAARAQAQINAATDVFDELITQIFAPVYDAVDELDVLTGMTLRATATVNDLLQTTSATTLQAALKRRIDKIKAPLQTVEETRFSAAIIEINTLRLFLPSVASGGGTVAAIDAVRNLLNYFPKSFTQAQSFLGDLITQLTTLQTSLQSLAVTIDADIDDLKRAVQTGQAGAVAKCDALSTKIQSWIGTAANFAAWQTAGNAIGAPLQTILGFIAGKEDLLRCQITYLLSLEASLRNLTKGKSGTDRQNIINAWIAQIDLTINRDLNNLADSLKAFAKDLILNNAGPLVTGLKNALGNEVGTLIGNVAGDLGNGVLDPTHIEALRAMAQEFASRELIPPVAMQAGKDLVLTLCEAAPPKVPSLDFPLDRLRLRFNDAIPQVDMTGVKALLDRAKDARIKVAGLEFPTSQLLDRILPNADLLSTLNLTDVFKDIGLPIEQLFQGIKLPTIAKDNIVLRHFLDQQSGRAGVEATADLPLAGDSVVFSEGPVTLVIQNARFYADARITASLGGQTTTDANSYIQADWKLCIGGLDLVTFVKTRLEYQPGGRIHFDISLDRVKVNAAMSFINELMAGLGYDSGGFKIRFIPNVPTSVEVISTFDTALPDLSFGTFGLSNISMGVLFGVKVEMSGGEPKLTLSTGFNFARKTAPFNLSIFILGGAGYVESTATYNTLAKTTEVSVSIGLFASAELAIDLGVAEGSVAIYFGIEVEYQTGQGGLSIGILLIISGNLTILSFIDASLVLTLEAQYTSGGGLIGTGTLSVSIKICWCFTFSICESITYNFGNSSSTSTQTTSSSVDQQALQDQVSDHVDMGE
jgi:hypothetical protein